MNKLYLIFITIFLMASCTRKIYYESNSLTLKDHNEVVKKVLENILSDDDDIIVGTPCLNGYIKLNNFTIAPYGVFVEEFIDENKGYKYDLVELDSIYLSKDISCDLKFCDNSKVIIDSLDER